VSVLTILALQAAAAAADKPECKSSRPQYGDTMQVLCALRASDAPKKFRFEVRFLGGHDDTRASLSATLNGQPLTCEEGSKPQLEGEFGEVSIRCQFSIRDAQELKVDVQWHHAQYADYSLDVS
jgi:hypothetical protein